MEVQIVTRADLTVVGLQKRVTAGTTEPASLWPLLMEWQGELGYRVSGVAYGISVNFDPASQAFNCLAGYVVEEEEAIPEGMERLDIPGGTYAELTCTLSDLMESLHQALHAWLPASGYAHTGGPELEF